MLYRYGNKKLLARDILKYFPKHDIFIEPFFGSGSLFFQKPKANHNIINDMSSEVFNLFMVLKNNHNEFFEAFNNTPVDENLFNYWLTHLESDPVSKAVRFVFISNNRLFGHSYRFALTVNYGKKLTLSDIDEINSLLEDVVIASRDFELFLKKIQFRVGSEKHRSFIYADPPYLSTYNNYELPWTEFDTIRLFETLAHSSIRYAITEYDSDMILLLAREYKLNIIPLKEKKNGQEILLINYPLSNF